MRECLGGKPGRGMKVKRLPSGAVWWEGWLPAGPHHRPIMRL